MSKLRGGLWKGGLGWFVSIQSLGVFGRRIIFLMIKEKNSHMTPNWPVAAGSGHTHWRGRPCAGCAHCSPRETCVSARLVDVTRRKVDSPPKQMIGMLSLD